MIIPDSLKALGGDIQQEPTGYEALLFDFETQSYLKQTFKTENEALELIGREVDALNDIAAILDTQQLKQVYKYD